MSDETVTLWRPTGPAELELVGLIEVIAEYRSEGASDTGV
jgi:hypothetical protein